MKLTADQLLLYAVTDRSWTGKQTLYQQVESALKGGVTIVQLREKDMDEEQFLKEAIQIKALCRQYGVPLIINDRVDIALKSGADGVHVGIEDQPVAQIRQMTGKNFLIGATAKTVEQAQKAQQDGADYLGVGAVFPSPTKKNAIRITPQKLQEIVASVSIPAVAIGGINQDNLSELQGSSIAGAALVSAIFSADDIESRCRELKTKLRQMIPSE
ncbi:MAG: thiamine phosphate synthase [Massiliimalia sp.]|jgi:thiamine-phosphate pyrophosphorylase